jgi:U3 small nucleolar RNA-associated protein 22
MAPPATKRRKLEHSDAEEESEGSFADFDSIDGTQSDEGAEEDGTEGSDSSLNGLQDLEDDDMMDDDDNQEEEDAGPENDASVKASVKSTPAVRSINAQKPVKRPAPHPQDGVYTSETFKSNVFKLQVDELLEQVKLRYGKKQAPAENAMRVLKSIIEQIPSRDALAVCPQMVSFESILTGQDSRRREGSQVCRCGDTLPTSTSAQRRKVQAAIHATCHCQRHGQLPAQDSDSGRRRLLD